MTARPLRVLHVIQSLTGGGAENFLCALASSFDERNVNVALMSIYPTNVPLSAQALARIPVFKIERRGRYDSGFLGRMIQCIREYRPDIVHTHLHNGKYWGRLAALIARVPVILFTEHNPCGEHRILPEIAFDLVMNYLTAGIITFGEQQRALLARAEGLPASKAIVIENGIALPAPATSQLRERARRELGVAQHELAILVVARLIARKNQQLAIRAVECLPERERDRVRLFIAGSGEDGQMLRELASSSFARDRIVVMGNRPDAVDLLYGADIFYMPSLAEGMPLAMLEAMSVGVPVLSAPWTGVRELLRDGELGTILADWQPQTSAAAIRAFMQSPDEFAQRAARALEYVRAHHDIAQCARTHERLYQELARARGIRFTGADAVAETTIARPQIKIG